MPDSSGISSAGNFSFGGMADSDMIIAPGPMTVSGSAASSGTLVCSPLTITTTNTLNGPGYSYYNIGSSSQTSFTHRMSARDLDEPDDGKNGATSKTIAARLMFSEYGVRYSESLLRAFLAEPDLEFPWEEASGTQIFSSAFMREYKDRISWSVASREQTLTEADMIALSDRIDWVVASLYQAFTSAMVFKFAGMGLLDMKAVSANGRARLTAHALEKYKDSLDWRALSHRTDLLSDAFVRKYGDMPGFDVAYASELVSLSEKTIIRYLDRVDYRCPSMRNRKFKDGKIICYMKLKDI